VPEAARRSGGLVSEAAAGHVAGGALSAPEGSQLLRAGSSALCFTLLLGLLLPGVGPSYLITALLSCAAAVLISRTEAGEHRRTSLNLFVWAMLIRCIAVTACYTLGLREGGPFLGPDSATYYTRSGSLAASAFYLDAHPVVVFGSYDVSHYYLFAAAVRFFRADLFGLQVMNCGLIALAAPLVFGIARSILPSAALVVGLGVALHPSLVAIAAVDLLKDPSIIFGTVLVIWVIVRMTREQAAHALVLYFLAGTVAAVYLRTGRFYSFAYLEMALIAGTTFMMLLRVRVFQRTLGVVLATVMFVLGEVVPARASWPPSPLMIASSVSHVLGTPQMSQYALGLFDRLGMTSRAVPGGESGEKGPRLRTVHLGPDSGPLAIVGTGISFFANLFRRLYGPFVWILPTGWSFQSLQAGDYLLYPGMLVWYGLLPLIVAGLGATGWRIAARTETRFGIVFLWLFTAVYFAQYLMINLSYRQRDVMLPVLFFFAWLGIPSPTSLSRWRRWYAAYWIVLALIAGGHLLARALLRA
jgi:hypothetical protein